MACGTLKLKLYVCGNGKWKGRKKEQQNTEKRFEIGGVLGDGGAQGAFETFEGQVTSIEIQKAFIEKPEIQS